jgi:glycosyltransferase involved in cell wall biosynthesis
LKLTVIVPALNEADGIAACLQSVRRQAPAEIVVVDGGSEDAPAANRAATGQATSKR